MMRLWYRIFCLLLPALLYACATAGPEIAWVEESVPTTGPVVAGEDNSHPTDALHPEKPVATPKETVEPTVKEAKDSITEDEQDILDNALDFYQASQEFWSRGELEEALEALDEAYSLILKVGTDNDPEVLQQKEDLRFMISKRILEIYASRYTAVNGNHEAIPLTMNKYVEYEIKNFQTVERDFFLRAYKRSGRYRPMIVEALREAGLPEELSWLPLIESGFKVKAMSRARAMGLWQFIASTGYKYGLKRDTWIDERLDPEKSTASAIAYLKELHDIFGDWTTVLAAYNCGEGNVLRVIRQQRINYLDNFWDLYERLPRETARYVPRFLATLHIIKDPERYGFDLGEPEKPIPYELVNVNKQMTLKSIARAIGVSSELLSSLNPELRRMITPPGLYPLRVPPDKADLLLAQLDRIPRWSPPKRRYVYHRVRKGETLSSIALRYRTTVSAIARANNIKKRHLIRVGQRLKIPLKGSRVHASRSQLLPGGRYRVKKGDSLWLIAQRFNTDIETLKLINKLRTTRLYVGQIIKIPD
jgi:membrane-bound lytic murein transglycosylase D